MIKKIFALILLAIIVAIAITVHKLPKPADLPSLPSLPDNRPTTLKVIHNIGIPVTYNPQQTVTGAYLQRGSQALVPLDIPKQ